MKSSDTRLTRRQLLGASAALPLAGAAAVPSIQREMPWHEGQAAAPSAALEPARQGYVYLAPAEAAFVEAAVARMIPADDLGPGALEAGVPTYIDRQLAGPYGSAERWYMQGPWAKGEDTQGYQTRLTPAALYRAAIREIDAAIAHDQRDASFAKLPAAEQDAWLHRLEDAELQLPTADAKTFFAMLWQNTLEGFWSDPIYGGNRDMAGWKLIGFPGARYDYGPFVARHGQAYPLPPVGLKGRVEWFAKG